MNETFNLKILSKLKPNLISIIKSVHIFGEIGSEVIVVTKEDNVFSFGSNRNGCLSLHHDRPVEEPTKLIDMSGFEIKDISCGYIHVIALLKTGICYCWGRNDSGQLGINSSENSFEPKLIEELIDIIAISCGAYHSLVLTQNGGIYGFGNNSFGQLGFELSDNISKPILKPQKLTSFEGEIVLTISCGFNHSLALTECGHVFSWGHNSYGQLGIGNNCWNNRPVLIEFDQKVSKVVSGFGHSLLLTTDGYYV